ASLHAPQVRFMAQRAASYGEAVLHKSLTMKHRSASLHNMKHLHFVPKSAGFVYKQQINNFFAVFLSVFSCI
ncbi:MAG: hypothetical protein IKK25_07970, partial [Lentisphaeria bacterium]|nr:hypothetical protein [Lentisphaeria bacterium]